MAATLQHACNRRSDVETSLFRNDMNNVAALQSARQQKRLMEEAARLQQKQLDEAAEKLRGQVEDTERVQQERDELRQAKESLGQAVARKTEELASSQGEVERLRAAQQDAQNQLETLRRTKEDELTTKEAEKRDLQQRLDSRSNDNDSQRGELETLRARMNDANRKLPRDRQDNCLPAQYHNSTVMIVNARSHMAIDMGYDDCTKAHAWEVGVENANQIFKLTLVHPDEGADSPWIIARNDDNRRLYYPSSDTGTLVHCGSAPGRQDFWFIGHGSRPGSWLLKNAEWDTYIELQSGSRDNGTCIKAYAHSDNWDANWLIIPMSFN